MISQGAIYILATQIDNLIEAFTAIKVKKQFSVLISRIMHYFAYFSCSIIEFLFE